MGSDSFLNVVQLASSIIVLPIAGMLWNIQARISRLEGLLEIHLRLEALKKDV